MRGLGWDLGRKLTAPLDTRITSLEDTYVRACWFEEIASGTSGTLTLPTSGSVVLNQWEGNMDALASKISSSWPSFESPVNAGGTVITAMLDASGNWTLSDTPSSYPVAIIYIYRVKLVSFDDAYSMFEAELEPVDVAANTAARHTQGTDTTLGIMTADIDMNSLQQVVNLQAPAASGEAIRQTTKITEMNMEAAHDHVSAIGNQHSHDTHDHSTALGTAVVADLSDITSSGTNIEDAVTKKHTQNSDIQLDNGVISVDASDNVTLNQNAVAVLSSLASGAVVNTLYLKEGKIGIKVTNPTHAIHIERDDYYASFKTVSTVVSGAGGAGGFLAYSDDGAIIASEDRLGYLIFGGASDSAHTLKNACGIIGYADGNWAANNYSARLDFQVTAIGAATRSTKMKLAGDGGLHFTNMKNGTTQANAGAIAGELWYDTDDGNTVKMGV